MTDRYTYFLHMLVGVPVTMVAIARTASVVRLDAAGNTLAKSIGSARSLPFRCVTLSVCNVQPHHTPPYHTPPHNLHSSLVAMLCAVLGLLTHRAAEVRKTVNPKSIDLNVNTSAPNWLYPKPLICVWLRIEPVRLYFLSLAARHALLRFPDFGLTHRGGVVGGGAPLAARCGPRPV